MHLGMVERELSGGVSGAHAHVDDLERHKVEGHRRAALCDELEGIGACVRGAAEPRGRRGPRIGERAAEPGRRGGRGGRRRGGRRDDDADALDAQAQPLDAAAGRGRSPEERRRPHERDAAHGEVPHGVVCGRAP